MTKMRGLKILWSILITISSFSYGVNALEINSTPSPEVEVQTETKTTAGDLPGYNMDETNALINQRQVNESQNFNTCESQNYDATIDVACMTGWRTTDDNGKIQVVGDSPNGTIGVELNAESVAAIFKDFDFTVGQRLFYTYEHRGRSNVYGNPNQNMNGFIGPAYEKSPYSANMNGDLFPFDGIADNNYNNNYRLQSNYSTLRQGSSTRFSGIYVVPQGMEKGRYALVSVYPEGACSTLKVCNVVDDIQLYSDAVFDNLLTLKQNTLSKDVSVEGFFEYKSGDNASGVEFIFTDKNASLDLTQIKNVVVMIDGVKYTSSTMVTSETSGTVTFVLDSINITSTMEVASNVTITFDVPAKAYSSVEMSSRVNYHSYKIEKQEQSAGDSEVIRFYALDNASVIVDGPPTLTATADVVMDEVATPLTDAEIKTLCGAVATDDVDTAINGKIVVRPAANFDSTKPSPLKRTIDFEVTDTKGHKVTTTCSVVVQDVLPSLALTNEMVSISNSKTSLTNEEMISLFGINASEFVAKDLNSQLSGDTTGITFGKTGVYFATMSVVDEEGNGAQKKGTVIVNDGSMQIGTEYALDAGDFNIGFQEFQDTDAFLKQQAKVQVYRLSDGKDVTSEVVINITKDTWAQTENSTHQIKFEVIGTDGTTVDVTNTITGTIDGLPKITFDPLILDVQTGTATTTTFKTGMSASDAEDGVVTDSVTTPTDLTSLPIGLHSVEYHVTDSHGNTVVQNRVVVINDGTYVVGSKYVIKATSFKLRIGEVNTSQSEVISRSKLVVYDGLTGKNVTATTPLTIVDNGYKAVVGVYEFTASVTDDATAKVIFTGEVVAGEIPVLTVPSFTEINVGDTFSLTTGVTVSDTEDTLAVSDVVVSPATIDTSVAGVVNIKYTVTDSDGNKAEATQTLLVNDGSFTAGDTYIIKATDFENRVAQVDTADAGILKDAQVNVFYK
ncbi:MAG: immunoglobulin-like domain-containing protein [Anaerorhabdus sp.]